MNDNISDSRWYCHGIVGQAIDSKVTVTLPLPTGDLAMTG